MMDLPLLVDEKSQILKACAWFGYGASEEDPAVVELEVEGERIEKRNPFGSSQEHAH